MEGGVESTIVEMPDNVVRSQHLSPSHLLEESEDQSVPSVHSPGAATSKVFDFAFDMNLNRTQQDAGNTKIHMDYSNV
ncbi:hypothetical protein FALCPG4_018181 [Fusarium falciforme]